MTTFRLIRTDRNTDASTLVREALLIGQALGNDLVLPHPTVAPVHAGIKWQDDAFWLSALAEAVTMRDGEAITHARLADGDVLRVGPYLLHLEIEATTLQITVEFALALSQLELAEVLHAPTTASPAEQAALKTFWEAQIDGVFADRPLPPIRQRLWQATSDLQRRWVGKFAALGTVLLLLGAVFVTWAWPRVYSPGALTAAHARTTRLDNPGKPGNALSASAGRCTSCHSLTGSMQKNCAACHTTPTFQADIASKHQALKQALKLECRACHSEHRGTDAQLTAGNNELCSSCHRDGSQVWQADGQPLRQPHGAPVSYPVKQGLWSWDGISQSTWQARGLPGQTVDFNLREQFHMLHAQGPLQGRTQCSDCHLGGTTGPALKLNVRASCAQCHSLQPAFAAELAQAPESETGLAGATRCVSCHAQHGPERDLRASTRQ